MSYVFQSTSENHPSLHTPDQKAVLPAMLLFLHRGAAGLASTEQQRSRGREREREEGRRGSDRLPLLVRSIPSPDLCRPLSLHTKSTEIGGGDVGEHRGTLQSVTLFTSVPNPSLPSCPLQRTPKTQQKRSNSHFFLLDFSDRLFSDFSPLSDLSERSGFSAFSARSPRSERSPPRSDLLSALLPSRRVPSSVDEVVG